MRTKILVCYFLFIVIFQGMYAQKPGWIEKSDLDWFYNPPKPTKDYYYTIGISDPGGLDKEQAIKQAKTRACMVYCLLNKALILTKGENYGLSYSKKDSTQLTLASNFCNLTLSSGKIPNPEILKTYTNKLGETILLVRFNIKAEDDLINFDLAEKEELTSKTDNENITETITKRYACNNPSENTTLNYSCTENLNNNNSERNFKSFFNHKEANIQSIDKNIYKLKNFYEEDFTNIDQQFISLNYGLWNAYYCGIKQYLWLQIKKIKLKGITVFADSLSKDITDKSESLSIIQDSLNTRNFYIKRIGKLDDNLCISILNTDTSLNSLSPEKTDYQYEVLSNIKSNNLPSGIEKYKTDENYYRASSSGKSKNLFISELIALHNNIYEIGSSINRKIKTTKEEFTEEKSTNNTEWNNNGSFTGEITSISIGNLKKKYIKINSFIDKHINETWLTVEYSKKEATNNNNNKSQPLYKWDNYLSIYNQEFNLCNQ